MKKNVTKKDIIKFFWFYWGQNKKAIPVLLLVMAITAIADALFPLITGNLINEISNLEDRNVFTRGIMTAFSTLIIVDVMYHTCRNGGRMLYNRYMAMPNLKHVVEDGFDKVQQFSSDWHANNFGGATVRKITRGMWAFDQFEDSIYLYFYVTAILLTTIVVIMALQWPIMGLVTLIAIIVYISISIWTVLKINAPHFKAHARVDTRVGAAIADSITSNATVKAFGNEEAEFKLFKAVTAEWKLIAYKCWQVMELTDYLRRLVAILMTISMIGTILYLYSIGKAEIGDIVYVTTTIWVIFAYLRHVGEKISDVQKAVSEMEDVIWYWKTDIAVKDKVDASVLQATDGHVVFDDIDFTYDNQGSAIYEKFSLDIKSGEKIALVGESGSGKSTFVKLLQRLYDIQGGEILIDGTNIADVTQSSLRKAVALVPQDPILFHRSLRDNIAYAKPDADIDEVIAASKRAYAHDFIMGLPQGYDTLVGERGIKLSGGERQRVAIARAILSEAPILILDEATSALDSISEDYIQKALTELMKGRTTITIAHRLSTIKNVDRILVFDNGKVIEEGMHEELLKNENSHYKKLFDMQVMGLIN